MVEKALLLFKDVFYQCAIWTNSLLDAVGGKGVVLAAFVIVLVIGLLFIPMRGNAATNIKAYSETKIHANKVKKAKSGFKKGG